MRRTETKRPKTTTFLVLLDAAAIAGMLTLALHSTPALGPTLVLHLGSLAGCTSPTVWQVRFYGVHLAALLCDVAQRRAAGGGWPAAIRPATLLNLPRFRP